MAIRSDFVEVEEAPWARWLFASKTAAWIWLVARLWLGYEWLHAGWEKVFGPGHAAWMSNGKALKGFAAGAIAASKDPEHPQVAYGWWVSFLNWVSDNAVWMAKLVAVGEIVIGIALILGLFTGIFAFLGVVLNFSFVFSGSAGVNPAFIIIGLLLVLAWRNAGWIGLDRFLLPRLGTPWRPATMARERTVGENWFAGGRVAWDPPPGHAAGYAGGGREPRVFASAPGRAPPEPARAGRPGRATGAHERRRVLTSGTPGFRRLVLTKDRIIHTWVWKAPRSWWVCRPSRPTGIPTLLERIPSPLTLGGDLGKRRSAQRLASAFHAGIWWLVR